MTATATNTGDEFTVKRKGNGVVEHLCKSPKTKTGCLGHAETASSW